MTLCYLGLGSNLRSPPRQIRQAIKRIKKLPRSSFFKASNLYFSRASGLKAQPAYCNLVVALYTSLSPQMLLRYCHSIESKHGRIRKLRWGARTMDIDILLYGKFQVKKFDLQLPHPQLKHRDFVLIPLLEIAPGAQLPDGREVKHYLQYAKLFVTNKKTL